MRIAMMAIALAVTQSALAQVPADDPYVWLEEVEGTKALDWVKARNKESQDLLEAAPNFRAHEQRAMAILNDTRRIAYPDIIGESVYNFWQDAQNIRGIWRTASLASYTSGKPVWQTVLDMDALSKAEGKNWVWKGANCLKPDNRRCLVSLSNGGKDAVEVREFDLGTRQFVGDGFVIPEAKQAVDWWDKDTLIVGTNWGDGALTSSGYARILKLWKRGTPLASAAHIAETAVSNVWLNPLVAHEKSRTDRAIYDGLTFWTGKLSHVREDGSKVASPLPDDADIQGMSDGRVFALLRTDFDGKPKGALVAYAIDPLLQKGSTVIELVYAPGPRASISGVSIAKASLYVSVLDNVTGKLFALRKAGAAWAASQIKLPANGVIAVTATADTSDLAFVRYAGFTTPDTLYAVGQGKPKKVAALPARFEATKFSVAQKFASSKDGTKVPYFVVRPKGVKGPLPTWMYGYGGFEISVTPNYVSPAVQFWLEGGGQYVVANIRGGGEFGPEWHQSALKANRQRAYDDFHSVAEALVASKATSSKQLAIDGRSNGGLLVGVAYTQRPELYGAVLMGVPLADMKRYHLLLAGASWMGEYGNPDVAEEWGYISKYSPYQNIAKTAAYPKVFFYTSTKDDRVHPAHARKMAARMAEYGHAFYYYENIDGGHAGVANLKENAYRAALMLAYLERELKGEAGAAPATSVGK
jgi:prolyl oligopeptidase